MARQNEPPDDDPPAISNESREDQLRETLNQLQILEHIANSPQGLSDGDRELLQKLEQQERELRVELKRAHELTPANDNLDPYDRAAAALEVHSKLTGNDVHHLDVPQAVVVELLKDLMHYCRERTDGETLDSPYHLNFEKLVEIATREYVATIDPVELDPRFQDQKQQLTDRQARETAALIEKQVMLIENPSPEQILDQFRERQAQKQQFKEERQRFTAEYKEAELARHTPEMKLSEPKAAAEDPELEALLKNLGARQAKEALELSNRQELQIHGSPTRWQEERHQQERDDQNKQFEKERERYIGDYQRAKEIRARMGEDAMQESLEQGMDDGPKFSR